MAVFDKTIADILNARLRRLEKHFDADAVFYYGEIHPSYEKFFRDFIEQLKITKSQKTRLIIVLNTPGGSAETVEKMVEIIRHHYDEVYFVVPDYAMSAGTIFCMSGEKIYMDYSSSLGSIDPQVFNGKEYVPALGYLEQVQKLIAKSRKAEISDVEFAMFQNLDLATLNSYEQAAALSEDLTRKWLAEYKFKNWTIHRTDANKKGQPVTRQEKEQRADEIAKELCKNERWHSHGRNIGIDTLRNSLRIEIEDYSNDKKLRPLVRQYNDLLIEYIRRTKLKVFLHSKYYF
ncbi:MAG: ATP-dependent Clp protease proteolytic subunit [Bacteroidota bacterium]|jgi:hypothetical protein